MSTDKKQAAARAALQYLPETGVIGLGSGSTAKLFIDAVGELVRGGRKLLGVPTSEDSRAQAQALGIPLLDESQAWRVDVCVDGADEVNAALDLIKGGGGCHTREKIINYAAARNVIIVDDSKLSQQLGEKWPVPVEVVRFGHLTTAQRLGTLGRVELRLKQGSPWITDGGNLIYDVTLGPIPDPQACDRQLRAVPGVVETGLFVGRADVVIVAADGGTRILNAQRA